MRNVAADLATVLEAAGLGLARPPTGSNLFLGPMPTPQDDPGTVNDVAAQCVAILQTGGGDPSPYIGQGVASFRPVTCQVAVRSAAEDFEAGQTLALQVFDALHLATASPYVSIRVREAAPTYFAPRDTVAHHYWTLNVVAEYRDDGTAGTPISLPDSGNRTVSGTLTVTGAASAASLTVSGALAAATLTVGGSAVSGTNTGNVSLTAVGSTPNASGASLSGQSLTLQPGDVSSPGLITAGVQTIGGAKTFAAALSSSLGVNVAALKLNAGAKIVFNADFNSSTFIQDDTGGSLNLIAAGGVQTLTNLTSILGSVTAGVAFVLPGNVKWLAGTGSPEGAVSAVVGSLYSRTDGGIGSSFYVKETGSGNTGWAPK